MPHQHGRFTSWSVPGRHLRRCGNSRYDVCNWMLDGDGTDELCTACRHNRVVPDETSIAGRAGWRELEAAKHRLFVAFHRLGLVGLIEQAGVQSLGFLFLQDPPGGPPIMTGHAHGLITIAVKETDDIVREQRRHALAAWWRSFLSWSKQNGATSYVRLPVIDPLIELPLFAKGLRNRRDRLVQEESWLFERLAFCGITDGEQAHVIVSHPGLNREQVGKRLRTLWPKIDLEAVPAAPSFKLSPRILALLGSMRRGLQPARFMILPRATD